MSKQGSPFAAELPGSELRNVEIVRRCKAGEDFASIGVRLDLTRERIRQIVRSAGARMPREYKRAMTDCFTAPRWPQRYCCEHQHRLELYDGPLGTRPLLRETHGTRAAYQEGGCRCDLCRRAVTDRWREDNARRRSASARVS